MYIVVVHEKGQYDDKVQYEFETMEEVRSFLKAMQGILFAVDVHKTA